MITVSPHTKLLTLEVACSKPSANKQQKEAHKSHQDHKKDIMLFKLIKNHFPPCSNFTPLQNQSNDPFRLPTRIRERKNEKIKDFNFKQMLANEHESRLTFLRASPDPNDLSKKLGLDQVHYVKKLKARMIGKSRLLSDKGDAALLISKKKILPAVSSRTYFTT